MFSLLLWVATATTHSDSPHVLSPLITAVSVGVGVLTLLGFVLAARAYVKAKSFDTLDAVNTILRSEVDALQLSRGRMELDLKEAMETIAAQGEEIARLRARTDLVAHQQHLDGQHAEVVSVLTRIADESQSRNGDLSRLVSTVLDEARAGRHP